MPHPNILIDSTGAVTTVTIDRPRRKNACTPSMWTALREGFRDIAASSARAVVITGAGGEFCVGADMAGGDEQAGSDQPSGHRIDHMRDLGDTVMAIHDCPRPVIAKIDGVAAGGGLGVALAADMAWCSPRSRFSLIFARRGLSLDCGTSWMLPKRIGLHEAKRLAFTGDIIDAERAAELGIVNGVVATEEFDAAVDEIAATVAAGPPIALATTKRYLNNAANISLFQALEAETLGQGVNFATRDAKEAMRAFVEKRDPTFEGW